MHWTSTGVSMGTAKKIFWERKREHPGRRVTRTSQEKSCCCCCSEMVVTARPEVVAVATLHTTAEPTELELQVRCTGGTPPYTVEFWRTASLWRAQRCTVQNGLASASVPLETAMSGIVVRACGGGAWTARQTLGAADLPLVKASTSLRRLNEDSPDLSVLLSLAPFQNPATAPETTGTDGDAAVATTDAVAATTTSPPSIAVHLSASAATSQSVCLALAFAPQPAAASGRAIVAISPLAAVGAASHVAVTHVGRALAAVPYAVGEKLHQVGSNVRLSVAEMAGTAAAATIDRALAISAYAASGIGRQVSRLRATFSA